MPLWKGECMVSVRWVRLAGVVLLVSGLAQVPAAAGTSAVEELCRRMPDETIAFVGTSGGDVLKGDFEKTIVGRMWNDPGVREFYRSIKTELIVKARQETGDPNIPQKVDMVLDYVRLALSRPIVIGIMPGPALSNAPPLTAFAILDAGGRRDQLVAIVDKLETMTGRDGILDKEIGSLKMRAIEDRDGVLVYWGWAGNYFVMAANDARGAAVKYLSQPRSTAPAFLGRVPGSGDALVAYGDIGRVFGATMREGLGPHELAMLSAVCEGLGLRDVKSFTLRAGFAGADVSAHAVLEMPAPTTGVLAALKPVDPSWLGAVDARALMVNAVNCDLGAVYDTILGVVKTASPDEAYPEIRQVLADLESQAGLRIREGLFASLAGPIVVYSLPVGTVPEAATGGGVVLARLKDAALFEKSMTAMGEFATEKAQGQLQVSSQKRDDGRTVHIWAAGPAAMMGWMPTWSIADGHLVAGSNMELHDLAVNRFTGKQADANSLLEAAGYKKATAGMPENVTVLTYTDSRAYFNQSMMQIQQFWPMVTMMAMKEGIRLPVILPSLTQIAADMGPSINYSYMGPDGLHSVYRGPGFENNQMTVGGTAVAMGILMPALARTSQLAFRMTSGTNLAGIGKACLIYAVDHDDRLPPDLQTLVTAVDLPAKALESKLKPEDFDGPSYIYIPGQDLSMRPGNVLAYENPEFCVDGVNVLFLDTHVEFMKPQAFRQALEATYTRLKRPLPKIRFKDEAESRPPVESLQEVRAGVFTTDERRRMDS